jgi:gluconokinase
MSESDMNGTKIIVMGVSGSGKSLVGGHLCDALGLPFFDADAFHCEENIRKMSSGIPLSDADRHGWLSDLSALIRRERDLVLACSALKRAYRDQLRTGAPNLRFLYLKGDFDTIWTRHAQREDHYFNGQSMLRSQFQQLEEPSPDEAHAIDIGMSPEAVLKQCLTVLKLLPRV